MEMPQSISFKIVQATMLRRRLVLQFWKLFQLPFHVDAWGTMCVRTHLVEFSTGLWNSWSFSYYYSKFIRMTFNLINSCFVVYCRGHGERLEGQWEDMLPMQLSDKSPSPRYIFNLHEDILKEEIGAFRLAIFCYYSCFNKSSFRLIWHWFLSLVSFTELASTFQFFILSKVSSKMVYYFTVSVISKTNLEKRHFQSFFFTPQNWLLFSSSTHTPNLVSESTDLLCHFLW